MSSDRDELQKSLRALDNEQIEILADRAGAYDHAASAPLRNAVRSAKRENNGKFDLRILQEAAVEERRRRSKARASANGGHRARARTVEIAGREVPFWALGLIAVGVGAVAALDQDEDQEKEEENG